MDIETIISKWRLDGIANKRMLFIECPFVSHNGNTLIFEYIGFDIKRHQLWYQELDDLPNDLEDNYQLVDFDIILVCISGIKSATEEIVISKAFLKKFKNMVQKAETKKQSKIPVVGMNLAISGEKQIEQAEVFDGLFIGRDTGDEQIRKMFRNLFEI